VKAVLAFEQNQEHMNLSELHDEGKAVSTKSLFKGTDGTAISLKLLAGGLLKEHITKAPALLICIEGAALFENEKGLKENLTPGDYIHIEANVKHWAKGVLPSELMLLK
jgi:quercetin dioxygenase-like cupin family protein